VRPCYLLVNMMTNAIKRSGAEAASVNGGPDVAEIGHRLGVLKEPGWLEADWPDQGA